MKLVFLICLTALSLTGCLAGGSGESYGYVTTVEHPNGFYSAHFRASYNSSQTDCYTVDEGDHPGLWAKLGEYAASGERVVIEFRKNRSWTFAQCSADHVTGVRPSPDTAQGQAPAVPTPDIHALQTRVAELSKQKP